MKYKLYLETTIPSYLTSWPSRDLVIAGHQQITKEWWKKRKRAFDIYISQLVVDEPCCCIKFGAWIYPVRNNAPLSFESQRLEFLTG
jgi:hypothetical protein